MSLDLAIFYFLNNLAGNSKVFDFTVIFLAEYLQYFLVLLFCILVYRSREKFYLFWVSVLSVIIARLGIVTIIRFFYHRPRPFLVLQVHQLIAESEWSFPSGHSAFFFALASAIYFYNKKWGIGFFLAAILMNVSRIIAGVHYPSDILGGAVVGMATAYIVFYFVKRRKLKEITKTP